eukprot:gene27744-36566_t
MSTFTSGMNEMRKQHSGEISVLTNGMDEMRKQHSGEIYEMRKQHSGEIYEMRKQHSGEISVLTNGMDEMRKLHSGEISVLTNGMDEMRKQHSGEISELTAGMYRNFGHTQEKLEELKKTHAFELQAMRFAADSTMRVLRRDLENSIDILRTANTDLTLQVSNLTAQVAALQIENAGLRRALNRMGGIGA